MPSSAPRVTPVASQDVRTRVARRGFRDWWHRVGPALWRAVARLATSDDFTCASSIAYYAPNALVHFRDVWVGAILTGLLWRLVLGGSRGIYAPFPR